MKNLASVSVIKDILAASGFKFSKSLGQKLQAPPAPKKANAFARDFNRCSRILGSPDHKILGTKVMRPPASKKQMLSPKNP